MCWALPWISPHESRGTANTVDIALKLMLLIETQSSVNVTLGFLFLLDESYFRRIRREKAKSMCTLSTVKARSVNAFNKEVILERRMEQCPLPFPTSLFYAFSLTFLSPYSFCHFTFEKVKVLAAQSYPTLYNPIEYSSPSSSVHRIFQERILEWVAISYSRGSSQLRDQTQVSCIAGGFFTMHSELL